MLSRRTILKGGLLTPALLGTWGGALWAWGDDSPILDDCGVASGCPLPDSIVLWTRIPAIARRGLSDKDTLPVYWDLATSPEFSPEAMIQSGITETSATHDYTVKVRPEGLEPFTTYYYRFRVGTAHSSVIGRTKTAPAPGMDLSSVKFAFVSCQNFSDGLYPTYANLAQEDVDFCLHLGDHIYEVELGRSGWRDPLDGRQAKSLDDYRAKWRYYLSDPLWREVRRLFAWIDLWDDHEIWNDYAGAQDRARHPQQVSAAYQAFQEYTPIASTLIHDPQGIPELRLHGSYRFGDLVELFVMDQRQYRTPNPCQRVYASPQCAASRSSEHTMLGATQKAWFKDALQASTAAWKIHASSVMMSPTKILAKASGQPEKTTKEVAKALFGEQFTEDRGIFLTLDQWDGYPTERDEILNFIHDQKIQNYVVVSGDIHMAFNSAINLDTTHHRGPNVGVELVTSSVSSKTVGRLLGPLTQAGTWLLHKSNPNLHWSDIKQNGYAVVEARPEGLTVRHMAVGTVWNPSSRAYTTRLTKVALGRSGFV